MEAASKQMTRALRSGGMVVGCLVLAAAMAAAADRVELRSGTLARDLTTALTERHLDAIAAPQPGADHAYVAALYYPGAQLLVVAAESPSPLVGQQIEAGAFRDAYATLHQTATPASKLFIVDMGADGLHADDKQLTDVVYDHVTEQLTFDGHPDHGDAEYMRKLAQADEQYSRLLQTLLDRVRSE